MAARSWWPGVGAHWWSSSARRSSRPRRERRSLEGRRRRVFEQLEPRLLLARFYVDDTAGGGNTGTSWADAFTDLQSALGATASGDEIWVAQGTYSPATTADRAATFQLKDKVAVYGGFPDGGGTWQTRNWTANATGLSGVANSAYHVVTMGTESVLDGFSVFGGLANGTATNEVGGGVYSTADGPTLRNCWIQHNRASSQGGGLFAGASITIENCGFYDNQAPVGAGALTNAGTVTITGSDFAGNVASSVGGGWANWAPGAYVYNTVFRANSGPDGAGAFASGEQQIFYNCLFVGNVASSQGGGLYVNHCFRAEAANCTFHGNQASQGGALHSEMGDVSVVNSIVWNNASPQLVNSNGTLEVLYSDVQGGFTGTGNLNRDPLFLDPDGADNRLGTGDDEFHLQASSPVIDAGSNNWIFRDLADVDGDGDRQEWTPLDLGRQPRQVDSPVADTGQGTPPILDMGAYEAQAATEPHVTAMSPAPDARLGAAPASIVVTFDQALDPRSVSPDTVRLVVSGGDGIFGNANDRTIVPTAAALTQPTEITLDLTGQDLPADVYQVTLAGTSGGHSLDFDGFNDRARINHDYYSTNLTVEMWVNVRDLSPFNPTGTTFQGGLLANGTSSRGVWEVFLVGHGNATVPQQVHLVFMGNWNLAGALWEYLEGSTDLSLGDWHHVAATYDGHDAKLYVDGQLDGSAVWDMPLVDQLGSLLSLGDERPGGDEFIAGQLDDLRIWSTVRSQSQIQEDMLASPTGTESGLLGYWTFDEGAGQVFHDLTPNQHDGVLGADGNAASDDPAWASAGAPTNRILGVNGLALDGEWPGSEPGFPSGDGTAGGDFVALFEVTDLDAPPRVVSTSPALGTTVASVTEMAVTFNQPLDVTTVVAANFSLVGSGGDRRLGTADDRTITGQVSYDAAAKRATFLPTQPLAADSYRLVVSDAVQGANGLSLDGEFGWQWQGLGDLPEGTVSSQALAVSASGAVVGTSVSGQGAEAFRWTESGGMTGLGDLTGGTFQSQSTGVSADGTVVVGTGISAAGAEALRWTAAGGMTGLGDLAGGTFQSVANHVSSDGAVVVGGGSSASGPEAFRWTAAGGLAGLGDLSGGAFSSEAHGISADAQVIVGRGQSATGAEAFRWTQAGGMVGLGDLPGGGFGSVATAASAAGSVVVGYGTSALGSEAFRWTQAGGMVGLGDLPGGSFSSIAIAVSADGSVVVGRGSTDAGFEGFLWEATDGMRKLSDVLTARGIDLTGWTLLVPRAIAADGETLVGYGTHNGNTEAWRARLRAQLPSGNGAAGGDFGLDFAVAAAGDLTVAQVDIASVAYGHQLLTAEGTVSATVRNAGAESVEHPFRVLFFEDRNQNAVFDRDADMILGETTCAQPLASGAEAVVTTQILSPVLFPKNLVWAWVDSGQEINETDETNNLGNSGQCCAAAPNIGQFDPVVEWQKASFSVVPNSDNVMMTPAVADLDADGIPDIVFSTFVGTSDGAHGTGDVLRAVRGSDGSELWNVTAPAYQVEGFAGLAVGDIDRDGQPEIVAVHDSEVLIAFEHDGTFKWKSAAIWGKIHWGSPSLADLDHDGFSEIIVGGTVLNHDGTIRWRGDAAGGQGRGDNGAGPLSAVADLDLDGAPEVVAGKSAYRADGSLYWNASIYDGFPALGNFDSDPNPEIVVVSAGSVYLLEHTGAIKWGPQSIPGGGAGGAPTVADVDGDGQPEIGVAGASNYVVFETDGSERWRRATQDYSSSSTGSSVFDFEGDGSAEIVYTDERYLRIYRGSDGQVLYQLDKGSGTTYEYPLIVDVDADGNAEIVAVANDYLYGAQDGLYVIGDRNDSWVSTRQIWNQHTYHVTNVNDDGTIPPFEQNSWDVHNTYRLNLWPGHDPAAAPNLIASLVRRAPGADPTMTVTARVGNGGAIHVPAGINVAFYSEDPASGDVLLGVTTTSRRLEPGDYEDVSLSLPRAALTDVWVRVDDDGAGYGQVRECNETDNLYHYHRDGEGAIRGQAFDDRNANAAYDTGEPGLPLTIVYRDLDNNGSRDTGEPFLFTQTDGGYEFPDLATASHSVRQERRAGWRLTTPASGYHRITLGPGQVQEQVDFGSTWGVAELRGTIWNDVNGNAVRDGSELDSGLAGWTIFLDANSNGVLDEGETSTSTALDGSYSFGDLTPGTYIVAEVSQDGWVQTCPGGSGQHVVALAAGDVAAHVDFGNRQGEPTDLVNFIVPRDGTLYVRGLGGLAGWRSEFGFGTAALDYNAVLTDLPRYTDEVPVGAVHTGELLHFIFKTGSTYAFSTGSAFTDREAFTDRNNSLGWGGTIVQATAPNTWVLHLDDPYGDDDDNDSWVQLRIATGVPGSGEIHGQIWNDRDGGGTRGGDEPGLTDWTVFLDYNANGRLDPGEDAVPTGANGDYAFTQLQPWTYTVAEVGQNGWTQTSPGGSGTHVVTVAASQVVTGKDFGNQGDEVPPRITAIVPDPGTPATQGVRQIRLTFSEAMEQATMWAPSFALMGSGGDGDFANGNEQIIEIANVAWNVQNLSATLNLDGWLPRDGYRLTAVDDLMDLSGNRLDGDGDGTAGGNWQQDFQVANTPPTAHDGQATTVQDAPVSLVLSATDPDGDALTFAPGAPLHGTLTDLGDANSATWLYTPGLGFHGQDSFSFTAADGTATSQAATVRINVAPAPCDLEPTVLEVTSPAHFSMGDTVSVHWTGVNHGPGETLDGWWADWQDQLYLSADEQLDGEDLALGTWRSDASPVAVAGTYNATLDVTLPVREWSGQYYLILAVNADRGQAETNLANNLRVLSIALDPFVRFVLPSVGRYADNETAVGFRWVDGDQTHAATLAVALDSDNNPANGNEVWLASGISEDAEDEGDRAQLYLPDVAPGEYFVRARLTNTDGDYYSADTPIQVFERAYYSEEAMNDAIGGSGYEVGGIEVGVLGDRVSYRVLSNFPPVDRGGDIYLNVGGLWQDHDPTDIVHGIAVNATTAFRGPLIPGDLYTNATFRTGIYHPERPTFITAAAGHTSGHSAAEVTSPTGIKTTYEITGWFDLSALPGYVGQFIQLAWAMYCGNDIDEVIIPGRDGPDLAITSIKYRPDPGEDIAGGIHQSAEPDRPARWQVTVTNVGQLGAAAGWQLHYLLSADQKLVVGSDASIHVLEDMPAIAAGAALDLTFTDINARVPKPMNPGFYYFGAVAADVSGEVYTENNALVHRESLWVQDIPTDLDEDNDTPATATDLRPITVNGVASLTGRMIGDMNDPDWYSFELKQTAPAGTSVAIQFEEDKGDLHLYLYAEGNTTEPARDTVRRGSSESVSLQDLERGTYFVKVIGAYSDAAIPAGDISSSYSLLLATQGQIAFSVEGRLTFEDHIEPAVTPPHPIRLAQFEIISSTRGVVAQGTTLEDGTYRVALAVVPQPGEQFHLRVYTKSVAVSVRPEGSWWQTPYVFDAPSLLALSPGVIVYDWTLPSTGAGEAWGPFDGITEGYLWLKRQAAYSRANPVTVSWPSASDDGYGSLFDTISLGQQRAWNRLDQLHEYGHAIQAAARGGLMSLGWYANSWAAANDHNPTRDEPYTPVAAGWTDYAFAQGWADFFACAVLDTPNLIWSSRNQPAAVNRGVNLTGAEFGGLSGAYYTNNDNRGHYEYPGDPVIEDQLGGNELKYYDDRGLSLIRLPFRWERLQPKLYGELDQVELGRLKDAVQRAAALGMEVILDPHNYARYVSPEDRNEQSPSNSSGEPIDSEPIPPNKISPFEDFWMKVATEFKGNDAIYAYALMNEPHDTDGKWPATAQAGVNGIRSVDRTHTILVPGDGWSSAEKWREFNEDFSIYDVADNYMFEAHQYFDNDRSGNYVNSYDADQRHAEDAIGLVQTNFLQWCREHGVQGFLGEYGVPSEDGRWLTVLDDFLYSLDINGVAGTYWAGGRRWERDWSPGENGPVPYGWKTGDDYPLSVDPKKPGDPENLGDPDKPQMGTLLKHIRVSRPDLESNLFWMGDDGMDDGSNDNGRLGDNVRGAAASILWDIFDGAAVGDDPVNPRFADLWTVFLNDDPDSIWNADGADDFYHYWNTRFGRTREVDEIFIDHGVPVLDDQYDRGAYTLGSGNDSSSNPAPLGTLTHNFTASNLIAVDPDWYAFTVPDGHSANVRVTFQATRGDLDLEVYRENETLAGVGSDAVTNGWTTSSAGWLPEGTYYARVFGRGDIAATVTYEGDFSPNYSLSIQISGNPTAGDVTLTGTVGPLQASDPDGDPLVYAVVSEPAHGSITFADGSAAASDFGQWDFRTPTGPRETPAGWVKDEGTTENLAQASTYEVADGALHLVAAANSWDRVKVRTEQTYGEGLYVWRVKVPALAPADRSASSSIGAFLISPAPGNGAPPREIDFEIGYGTSQQRDQYDISDVNQLMCYMTVQEDAVSGTAKSVGVFPGGIDPGNWYTLLIGLRTDEEGRYVVSWFIRKDGETSFTRGRLDYITQYGPAAVGDISATEFYLESSVENFENGWIGDSKKPPATNREAQFGYIGFVQPGLSRVQDTLPSPEAYDSFEYVAWDGHSLTNVATVTVLLNHPPTDIILDNTAVDENAPGAVIGRLTVVDEDVGATHDLAVDDPWFEIVAGQLKLQPGISLDEVRDAGLAVQVTATDEAAPYAEITVALVLTVTKNDFPWQNPDLPCDVDRDGNVWPVDVLIAINEINAGGSRPLAVPPPTVPTRFVDPSGDNFLGPIDVLCVINYINAHVGLAGEGESAADNWLVSALPVPNDVFVPAAAHASHVIVDAVSGPVPFGTQPADEPASTRQAEQAVVRSTEPSWRPPVSAVRRSHPAVGRALEPGAASAAGLNETAQTETLRDLSWLDEVLGEIAEDIARISPAASG